MNPEISQLYRYLSSEAAHRYGKRFILTSGDRTCQHQAEVSPEHAGSSYHISGEAFDAVVSPYDEAQQAQLGCVAECLGFRWGGRFSTRDPVHFDNGNRASPGICPA